MNAKKLRQKKLQNPESSGGTPLEPVSMEKTVANKPSLPPVSETRADRATGQAGKRGNSEFPHPAKKNLQLSTKLASDHAQHLTSIGKVPFVTFPDQLYHFVGFYEQKKPSWSARRDLAYEIVATSPLVLVQKRPVAGGQAQITKFLSYSFSRILSYGHLLGCLMIHPGYFAGRPEKWLINLTECMAQLEDAIVSHVSICFTPHILQAVTYMLNAKLAEELSASPAKRAQFHAMFQDQLLKGVAFELFCLAIQKGLTIEERTFVIESSLVPDLRLSSGELRFILNPILKNKKISLRVFSRILNPFIYNFAYKNNVEGYLTTKLSMYLSQAATPSQIASEQALLVEIHLNSPFIVPNIKRALKRHKDSINKQNFYAPQGSKPVAE